MGHAVERARQRADLVAFVGDHDAGGEIAGGDAPRGVDQLADRADQAIGDVERDRDRDGDDQQRADQQRDIEAKLPVARAIDEQIIVAEDVLG